MVSSCTQLKDNRPEVDQDSDCFHDNLDCDIVDLDARLDSMDQDGIAAKLGGKAVSLMYLHRHGKPVPPGFVLTTSVCREYHAAGRQLTEQLLDELENAVERLESKVGRRYGDGQSPLILAVRSGAKVSMPGTMKTILGCGRSDWLGDKPHSEKIGDSELKAAVCEVLDSWFSESAVSYRERCKIDDNLGTAVIVQVMLDTTCSGVVFTRDPCDKYSASLIIESVTGSGEGLVGGTRTGSTWIVDRQSGAILEQSGDAHLTHDQIKDLWRESLEIESLYGEPVDIEWGIANDELVFFQSRPIAFPLSPRTTHKEQHCSPDDGALVRHNLAESLQNPTPLTFSIWEHFVSTSGGMGQLFTRLGFSPKTKNKTSILRLVDGQIYAKPDALVDLYCDDYPFRYDIEELVRDPSALDRSPTVLRLDLVSPWFLLKLPKLMWMMSRARKRIRCLARTAEEQFQNAALVEYESRLAHEQRKDLSGYNIQELVQLFKSRLDWLMNKVYPDLLLPGVIGAASLANVERLLKSMLSVRQSRELSNLLWGSVPQAEISILQGKIGSQQLENGLTSEVFAGYAHRGFNELELAAPRWSENWDSFLPHVDSLKPSRQPNDDPPAPHELELRIRDIFRSAGISSFADEVIAEYRVVCQLLRYREEAKHHFLRGYALLRQVAQQLGVLAGIGDDVFFLTLGELDALCATPSDLPDLNTRKAEWKLAPSGNQPMVIHVSDFRRDQSDAQSVEGKVICPGQGKGTVVTSDNLKQRTPQQPFVFVCRYITPESITMFRDASAVVVEQASVLSHGAILARNLGVPVIALPDACHILEEGSQVLVDATNGTVTKLEGPK